MLIAAAAGIGFELIPFLSAMFGTEDLRGFVNSETPLTDVIGDAFGGTVLDIVTVVAILAILNASLAITLQFARILWASGRDRAWPEPASGWLGQVSREGSPWVATLVVGGLATALCLESDLITVVTFTAVLIVTLYALIALSAIVSRVYQRDRPRPYRMPLWPVPPLIALTGVIVALTQQKARDLLIVGAIFAGGSVYYLLFLRPRADRYWTMAGEVEPD